MTYSVKEEDYWVFGYGSLIWDHSNLTIIDEKTDWLIGWHRDWTFISKNRRHGAPTCNLEPGGKVKGKFFKLHSDNAERELEILRKREGRLTEKIVHISELNGEVHFWTMGRNLEKIYNIKVLEGRNLYQFLANIASRITLKGPDNKSPVEYAISVFEFDPEDEITKIYIDELMKLQQMS